ncbi:phosphate transport system regulatory protein PhoU [candidate division WOR-1 bacterium RIFOXYC2_FULL_37_10]|uniref:Phosphate-specific transport system accessory protein PhoU n=1 Tax=candidate division WOR-1 bacterium RIFOXYB2_FULL_37_13 TaxID=1802579 RepID=A0A1F4SPN9_UNCSA|nr:MAG: phosphate transport system regulatory protein PhoU [candidate division WOR-1 bacterium RIFOXYB2_FULL_37_13]OGC35394.1 MAG: phosphate transport system regulatory protein PhoU [candidate division WOR-1 bacterium RIFOXYC2_FULL_37_10]
MDNPRVFDHEMNELKDTILKMGVMVQGLIHKAVDSLKNLDRNLAEEVIKEDEKVDQLELEIDEKCIQLVALRQPEASDLRFLMTGMRISNDLERIGDLAEDIAERAVELSGAPLLKPLIDIPKMGAITEEEISLILDAFVNRNSAKAKSVWDKERQVDKLRDMVHDELVGIMSQDSSTVSRALPLLLVSRHLERISDHVTNIAEDVIYMVEGRVVKHGGSPS